MQDNFIFPVDLQQHLAQRLQALRTDSDTLRIDETECFTGRITDIKFKGTNNSIMSFKLDGKAVNNVILTECQQMMLELGEVTIFQLAVHHCLLKGKPCVVQPTLF